MHYDSTSMAASKKVKVDKKKITINIKKKATVKVSKKKITITGKKSGKTKLTVTVKGMIKCVIPVTVRKAGNTAVKKSDVGNNSSKNKCYGLNNFTIQIFERS